jgi:hypothetical protein
VSRKEKESDLLGVISTAMSIEQVRKYVGKSGHMEHWFGSAAIIQNFCCLEMSRKKSYLAAKIMVEHFLWFQFTIDE